MERDETREAGGRERAADHDADLSARLKRLGAQLNRARDGQPAPARTEEGPDSGGSFLGRALRLSTEFVAGVLVGFGIGWFVDRALGTSPWGLIVFMMLGFCAGIYNVMRAAGLLRPASGRDGGTGS
jgi:ATP synthase protein I